MRRLLFVLAVLACVSSAQAQTTRTAQLGWHFVDDITPADALAYKTTIAVDKDAAIQVTPTCVSDPLTAVTNCTAPVTFTEGEHHTITLAVENGFGVRAATLDGKLPALPAGLKILVTFTIDGSKP